MNQSNSPVVAPLGRRLGAAIVDRLVPSLIVGPWAWLWGVQQLDGWLIYSVAFGVVLLGWVLVQWWLYATRKAGLGYKLFRLELVGLTDGKAIGWGRMCLRSLILYALWALVIPGIVMVIFLVIQERRMGWHDLAVKSLAIARRTRDTSAVSATTSTGRRSNSTVGLPPHLLGSAAYVGAAEPPAAPIDHVPLASGTPEYGYGGPTPQGQPTPTPQQYGPPAQQFGAPTVGQPYGQSSAGTPQYGPPAQQPQQGAAAGQPYGQPSARTPQYGAPAAQQQYGAPASRQPVGQPSPAYGAPQPQAGYQTPPVGQQQGQGIQQWGTPSAPPQPQPQSYGQGGPQTGPVQSVPGGYNASPVAEPPAQQPQPGVPAGSPPVRIKPRQAPNDDFDGTRLVATGGKGARPADEGWHVRLDDGRDIAVTGLVLIGRNPTGKEGEDGATLIAAGEPGKTVSKTHLALNVDNRGLYVVDRGSTNGTALRDPAGGLEPCAANAQVRLSEGSVVSFGERMLQVLRYPAGRS